MVVLALIALCVICFILGMIVTCDHYIRRSFGTLKIDVNRDRFRIDVSNIDFDDLKNMKYIMLKIDTSASFPNMDLPADIKDLSH